MAKTILLIAGCLMTLALAVLCHADDLTRAEYTALLEKEVSKAAALGERTRSGDPYLGLPLRTERSARGFAPAGGGHAPLYAPEAVPFLMGVVEHGPIGSNLLGTKYDDLARCYTALSLGFIKDSRALEPLVEALKGEVREDRERPVWLPIFAARALAMLGDYRAVDPLIEAMQHEDPPVRAAAAGALSMLLEKPMVALADAADDPDRLTGQAARRIWGRLLGRCLDVYEGELRHGDPRRRASAASALGIYLKEPLKRLKMCGSSADERVRQRAQKALAEIRAIVGLAEKEPEGE